MQLFNLDQLKRRANARPTRSGPVRQDKQKSLRNQRRLFHATKLDRKGLRLYLEEDDDEREQRERLDKREAKNQEDKDSRTSTRVTRQRFSG